MASLVQCTLDCILSPFVAAYGEMHDGIRLWTGAQLALVRSHFLSRSSRWTSVEILTQSWADGWQLRPEEGRRGQVDHVSVHVNSHLLKCSEECCVNTSSAQSADLSSFFSSSFFSSPFLLEAVTGAAETRRCCCFMPHSVWMSAFAWGWFVIYTMAAVWAEEEWVEVSRGLEAWWFLWADEEM